MIPLSESQATGILQYGIFLTTQNNKWIEDKKIFIIEFKIKGIVRMSNKANCDGYST